MASYTLANFTDNSDSKICNICWINDSSFLVGDSFGSTFVIDISTKAVKKHRTSEDAVQSCQVLDNDHVLLGISNELLVYDVNALDIRPDDTFCRRVLPISDCQFDRQSNFLFNSSSAPDILVNHYPSELTVYSIKTNEIGVKSFCIKENSLICYMDLAAKVYVLRLVFHGSSDKVIGCDVVKSFPKILAVDTIRDTRTNYKMCWHPSRPLIVIPSTMGSMVVCYEDDNHSWQDRLFTCPNTTHDLVLSTFIQFGQLLATAAINGTIVLWKLGDDLLPSFDSVLSISNSASIPSGIADISWRGNDLLLVGHMGWTCIESCGGSLDSGSSKSLSVKERSVSGNIDSKFKRLKKMSTADSKEEDDDLVEEVDNITYIKRQTSHASSNILHEPIEAAEEEDAALDDKIQQYVQQYASHSLAGSTMNPALHEVIQISSTKYDEKGRRYLVWNAIGNITTRTEAVSNRIEIRFANKSRRNKQEAFPDNWGFTMASLSHEGAVFASDMLDDDLAEIDEFTGKKPKLGSTVYYHAFAAGTDRLHGANDSFTVKLNTDEAALCVAAGCGWIAVATSKGLLRLFSSTGFQLSVTWLAGPVVAICGYESMLAVVFNSSSTGSGLGLEMIHVIPNETCCCRQLATATVPLSGTAKMEWMCFSVDTHSLFIEDTAGIVSIFQAEGPNSNAWKWTPVLEIDKFKKSSGHKYWPVTVLEDKLAYVLLSGENKPAIYPEPVVATKAFRIPVCETKEGKDKGEETNERVHQLLMETLRNNNLQHSIWDLQVTGKCATGQSIEALEEMLSKQQIDTDRTILKLFQEACRMQRIAQAIDLALKIRTEKALTIAISIANHFGRSNLAQRVEDILNFRQQLAAAATQSRDNEEIAHENSREDPSNDAIEHQSAVNQSQKVSILDNEGSFVSKKVTGVNPFAKHIDPPSPSKKRTKAVDTLRDLQSPSPKKATLSRQSSFSQEARSKKAHEKTLL